MKNHQKHHNVLKINNVFVSNTHTHKTFMSVLVCFCHTKFCIFLLLRNKKEILVSFWLFLVYFVQRPSASHHSSFNIILMPIQCLYDRQPGQTYSIILVCCLLETAHKISILPFFLHLINRPRVSLRIDNRKTNYFNIHSNFYAL